VAKQLAHPHSLKERGRKREIERKREREREKERERWKERERKTEREREKGTERGGGSCGCLDVPFILRISSFPLSHTTIAVSATSGPSIPGTPSRPPARLDPP